MNADKAMVLVEETLGVQPLSAIHQIFGHNSVTYEVLLPERSVIVRMNREPRVFATTANNLAVLAGSGLPTPTVLAVDTTLRRVPFAYMILEKIPGRDLRYELGTMRLEQMTRLAEQIVGFQRQVGQLPQGQGYGYVGIGETGPYASWWDVPDHRIDERDVTGDDRMDRLRDHTRIQKERFEPYLRSVPPTCFLDDITVKNVIVQDGELQGLVDFDCVCYGDPRFWLALTATGIVSDVGTRELFYVEELKRLWGVSPEQEAVLALYSAIFALDFLHRFSASETPQWRARMEAAIEQWLHDFR
ncbi:MAG: aminoglycoside phosphotransferase [Chthonomonadaceae bacterium]|nr:aminoglycoside phosphotransferase [Chthonomonadaceae bacterium]